MSYFSISSPRERVAEWLDCNEKGWCLSVRTGPFPMDMAAFPYVYDSPSDVTWDVA